MLKNLVFTFTLTTFTHISTTKTLNRIFCSKNQIANCQCARTFSCTQKFGCRVCVQKCGCAKLLLISHIHTPAHVWCAMWVRQKSPHTNSLINCILQLQRSEELCFLTAGTIPWIPVLTQKAAPLQQTQLITVGKSPSYIHRCFRLNFSGQPTYFPNSAYCTTLFDNGTIRLLLHVFALCFSYLLLLCSYMVEFIL